MPHAGALIIGIALIALILVDAFETIIQPRRVTRRFRLSRAVLTSSWAAWSFASRRLSSEAESERSTQKDRRLGVYGPLALLLLLTLWAAVLIFGFALIQWGLGSSLTTIGQPGFWTDLYLSGSTFFTLGLGDVVPRSGWARFATIAEAATGFSFLALIIGYLPTIYSAFAAREVDIVLLDARAGTPPTAMGLFQRFGAEVDHAEIDGFLRDWERWSAQLLDSQLSYPVLAFFRSQHERQSWLSALTLVLDASSLILIGVESAAGPIPKRQARLTFAMARHTIGDLSQITNSPPRWAADRLPDEEWAELLARLARAGLHIRGDEATRAAHKSLRDLYEPYVISMSERLFFPLPAWCAELDGVDDWSTTAWQTDPAVALRAVVWDHPDDAGNAQDGKT